MAQRYRTILIAMVVTIVSFMELLDGTILTTALPQIARTLQTDVIDLKGAITTYLVSLAIFIPISGWMADRFGTRTTMLAAIGVFLTGSVACAVAPNLVCMVVFRALQGMGGALMTPVARLIIVRLFDREELIKVVGLVAMPIILGPVLGPLVGGAITTYYSWRWIFLVNVPIGITALVLIRLLLPNNVAPAREPFDSIGFLLGGLGLALVTVVLEIVDNGYLPLWSLALLLLTGVVLVLAALSHSKNRSTPLFDLSLFKIGTFRTGILMTVVGLLSCAGITFLVAVLLQDLFHYSAVHAGVVLFCSAVGAILTKPLIAPILGRVGYRWTLGGFPIVICASLLLLMTINDQTPDWYMCLALFVFGCGYSVFMNIVNSLPFLDVPPDKTSKATSLQGTILQLSSSLGVTCAALLLHRFLGDKQVRLGAGDSTTATLASFHLTFLVLGLVSLSLVTFSWLISGASKGLAIDQEGAQRLGVCE